VYNNRIFRSKENIETMSKDNVFNFKKIGIPNTKFENLIERILLLYNGTSCFKKKHYCLFCNGNIIGIRYSIEQENLISSFNEMNYENKIDVIEEFIKLFDKEICFNEKIIILNNSSNVTGYEITEAIDRYKRNIV